MSLMTEIEQCLRVQFAPTAFELIDESHLHAGHTGSQGGGQHFALTMKSATFAGLNRVRQHQMVYAALADLMVQPAPNVSALQGYIHALKLQLAV